MEGGDLSGGLNIDLYFGFLGENMTKKKMN